jgi:nitrogen fixation protein NifZ
MQLKELQPGDIIYAATDIYNDGTMPETPENKLLAQSGCRGVLINSGHLEEQPEKILYLVRFERADGLGPAVTCWPEELQPSQDAA